MSTSTAATMSPEQRVTTLFQLLETSGKKEHIGGKMTQLDHALQAAHLAKNEGADEETILAALLVNIGQLIPPPEKSILSRYAYDSLYRLAASTGTVSAIDHGKLGAEYLRQLGFPNKTCELVESDVMARRYLLSVDPQYVIPPLTGSVGHISYQEKSLSPTEIREFENDPLFKQKVQLRQWNPVLMRTANHPPALDTYCEMAIRNLKPLV
ncbi:hypothetical protein GGI19_004291 [Coemansia pectinata]|uniref:Uncharacterized protein n=1 Tax=Coemansia pectinata TaxID=1052879 RepID=A0A9W8GWC5_9FUNG|nr:hypothetical protein GGI19_004291 [Coemansia pectinata]